MKSGFPTYFNTNLPHDWKEDFNWGEAFKYGDRIKTAFNCDPDPFVIADVKLVYKFCVGQNDEDSWIMAGLLKDGRSFFLEAWCDYTGWG